MKPILIWSWIVLLLIGCGAKYDKEPATASKNELTQKGMAVAEGEDIPLAAADNAQAVNVDEENAAKDIERKIIYEGRVSLVVEEFEEMETAIPELIKQFDGYLREARINRAEGRWRSGQWIARIPSSRFNEFIAEVSELGIAEEQEQSTEDVTMEYLDLEARIASKKKLEQRIEEVLKRKGDKLSDQLEGERELMRVRSEIDSMLGRLNFLKNQVAYSTVTIDAREEKDYVPAKAPDFAGRIGNAWKESVRNLKIAGQNLVIAAVAFAPWIIPVSVVCVGLVFGWKRVRKPIPNGEKQ